MTAPWIYSTTPDGRTSLIKTLKTPIHDGWESSVILQTTVNKSLDPGFVWRHRGTPDTIRTYDLLLRKQTLYPAELRVHTTLNHSTILAGMQEELGITNGVLRVVYQ